MNTSNLAAVIQVEIAIVDSLTPTDEWNGLLIKAWKESLRIIEFQTTLNTDSFSIVYQQRLEVEACDKSSNYTFFSFIFSPISFVSISHFFLYPLCCFLVAEYVHEHRK